MGLDKSLSLETVYYSAQLPRDLAVLNVLGIVFDRVHFPGVYIPHEGFDHKDLVTEIERIEKLGHKDYSTALLLGMMRFTLIAPKLQDLCAFETNPNFFVNDDLPNKMAGDLYDAVHGPRREGWTPIFENNIIKGMPGNEVSLVYRGDYHYPCGALIRANELGLPLLNDMPGLPVPGMSGQELPSADTLSAMIAIQSVVTALPELPLMRPSDLMEFRAENQEPLRRFRRSMLRYSAELRGKIKGLTATELQEELAFFVKTTITPALDELREAVERPARPWHKRVVEGIRLLPQISAAVMAAKNNDPVLAVLGAYAPQVLDEVVAQGDKQEALKRSGLYYLLKVQQRAAR